MTETIPISALQYRGQLKAALAGAPQGLIADALADCDEHMQGALAANPGRSEEDVLQEVFASYGSPEEVANAYRQSEEAPAGPFSKPAPVIGLEASHPAGLFGPVRDPATYGALLYMLLSLVTGVFYFCWAIVGLSMTVGMASLIIGIPFFLLFVGSVRLLSHAEGRIVEGLLGMRMPRRLPSSATAASLWERIKGALTDRRTWSSIAYMLLMLPLGILYFVIAIVGLALPFGLILGGLWGLVRPGHIQVDAGPHWILQAAHSPLIGIVVVLIGGLLFLLVMHMARLIGTLHGRIAEHLLVRL